MASVTEEIDDSLYSRQRYVFGDNAMRQMAQSDVLLIGVGGTGIEIAKNLVLAGIRSLTVHDNTIATTKDFGVQFFIGEEDVKARKTRAEASIPHLSELNGYVSVQSLDDADLSTRSDFEFLKGFNCIVVTDTSLGLLLKLNDFCRIQQPPIKFIMADVYGLHSFVFSDFGDTFTILDHNGVAPKQFFIDYIAKENPGVVTLFGDEPFGFKNNGVVAFKEIKGMTSLNGQRQQIKVMDNNTFTIGDLTGDAFQPYESGGIATEVKIPQQVEFASLADQLKNPSIPSAFTVDYSKDPYMSHLAVHALLQFKEDNNRLPREGCDDDAEILKGIAVTLNQKRTKPVEKVDEKVISNIAHTAEGCLAPLAATVGGIAAQEVLKAVTGKFTPLNQWIFIDGSELADTPFPEKIEQKSDRYSSLRICLGKEMLKKLREIKVFMVGCGAIGCEMMKNYALLGIGSGENGLITITDDDLIEKSNLNRQFLFRPHHIQKPKSEIAAASASGINPDLNIKSLQERVCSRTQYTTFSEEFFQTLDVVVNALDNIEGRKFMDRRCVSNGKPLIETGTTGTSGNVQAIIPNVTETYSSHVDPETADIPLCTLKSFPSKIEHTIQWARDKFESIFCLKPKMFNKYWSEHKTPEQVLQKLQKGSSIENTMLTMKILRQRPQSWEECVGLARILFEKLFNHKAKSLLHAFPPGALTEDGEDFWMSPKRMPNPVEFDQEDDLHLLFIVSTARLYAAMCNIALTEDQCTSKDAILAILQNVRVPSFSPSDKKIVTDESTTKEDFTRERGEKDDPSRCIKVMEELAGAGKAEGQFLQKLSPIDFEKDDDTNGHIDFITSTSNLRAQMYSIEVADRYQTKRIAGNIIPAIATTTATVSGLAMIELIRYIKGANKLEDYHNCFLNLGLGILEFTEPGEPITEEISQGLSFTEWTTWRVEGHREYTLHDFIDHFKEKHGATVTSVRHDSQIIYESLLPGHKERLQKTMTQLLNQANHVPYVELKASFQTEDPDSDVFGPTIKYYFG